MKLKITPTSLQNMLKVAIFLFAIAIIIQLFPKKESFEYKFNVGKPWSHELITAPFDYPIYKDKSVYEAEKMDLIRSLAPYYDIDYKVYSKVLSEFVNSTTVTDDKGGEAIPFAYKKHIGTQLKTVYSLGIIQTDELKAIKQKGQTKIKLVDSDKYAHTFALDDLFTVKSAYEYIVNNRPVWMDEDVLKSLNLNKYIQPNLSYNKILSDREEIEVLKMISLTSGMVQAGERIVDRGEIVTKRTNNLLNSLNVELKKQQKITNQQYNWMLVGELLIIFSLMLLLFLYLYLFRKQIYDRNRDLVFLLLMILLMLLLAVISLKVDGLSIYVVPFALLPIIIRTFFDTRTAFFIHMITILKISLIVPNAFEFILIQLVVGMTVVSSLKDLTQRAQLFRTSVLVFLTYAVIYIGNCLLVEGDFAKLVGVNFLYFGINALLLLFAYGLIYIFEKAFGFLSNVTLVELSNVNTPLLLQLSETAPGTFQHSLQLANLVTEAGKKINANTLLLRIGALYHDIGKIKNPTFYTENQLSGINPLAELDYETAAQRIIEHVKEGVRLAEKHGIPERVIDFIRTHHGISRTRYFYNSFVNKYPNMPVNEKAFMYEGPSPTTKEQALLMMADAVEASSRSLNEYSDETINMLVETIINKQITDGLFKEAKITFVNVEIVKEVFKEKLKTIYHTRVSYPELNKDKNPTFDGNISQIGDE